MRTNSVNVSIKLLTSSQNKYTKHETINVIFVYLGLVNLPAAA